MLDTEEVKNQIATYAKGADCRNDAKIMGPLFSEDAVWECEGFGRYEGREEIAENPGWARRTAVTWTLHYMISPIVKINPDAEIGTTTYYLWELANMLGKSGEIEACCVGGNYKVDLVKVALRRALADAAGRWA